MPFFKSDIEKIQRSNFTQVPLFVALKLVPSQPQSLHSDLFQSSQPFLNNLFHAITELKNQVLTLNHQI